MAPILAQWSDTWSYFPPIWEPGRPDGISPAGFIRGGGRCLSWRLSIQRPDRSRERPVSRVWQPLSPASESYAFTVGVGAHPEWVECTLDEMAVAYLL